MKITKRKINEILRLLVEQSLTRTLKTNIAGKDYIIVNNLEYMTGLVDLLIQGQKGGSAGFGNYFEDIVIFGYGNRFNQLNDGAGGPFPFADVHEKKQGHAIMYSVKMKRILGGGFGGGTIKIDQIRAMLKHPTTVSSFSNLKLKLGLISGALDPSGFLNANAIGIPIKITILEPDNNSPVFKRTKDTATGQALLCVKPNGAKDPEKYAKDFLGSGQPSIPGLINSKLTLDSDGFYKINADDKIFEPSSNNVPLIAQNPLVHVYNSLIAQELAKTGISYSPLSTKSAWLKIYKHIKKNAPDRMDIIKAFKKSLDDAIKKAKESYEEQYRPSDYKPSTYEAFQENILGNTGVRKKDIYMMVTGGFINDDDILSHLKNNKKPPANILSLINKVTSILSLQAQHKKAPDFLAKKLINLLSKEELIAATKNLKNPDFPQGFFLKKDSKGKIVYTAIDDENLIPAKMTAAQAKKQKISAIALSKQKADVDRLENVANKMLITIAVSVMTKEIEGADIPFSSTVAREDIAKFRYALKEFFILKQISNESMGEKLLSKSRIQEINKRIEDFRNKVVIPLANKVIPISGKHKILGKYTRNSILKNIGVLNELLNMDVVTPDAADGDMQNNMNLFSDESLASNIIKSVNFDHASTSLVVSTLINLAVLLDEIILVGSYDPLTTTSHLNPNLNESKLYAKILSELLSKT